MDIVVKSTGTSRVSGSRFVIINPDRIVAKGERMNDCASTTSAPATTIFAYQLLGQLKPEGLDVLEGM